MGGTGCAGPLEGSWILSQAREDGVRAVGQHKLVGIRPYHQGTGYMIQGHGAMINEPGARNQEPEVRSQESGTRDQGPGVRSQELEARGHE